VKPPIIIIVTFGLALTASAHAATDQPRHLDPNAPRTVTVSESEAPPLIRAGLLQSTLILLPNEEKVATVFGGDTVNWVFDGGHVASRFISVKPKVANATTDIHIVSDHGNEYTLQLREVSGEGDSHYDSKVFIEPGDKASKDRLASLPVFVPASELDKAKEEAAAAEKAKATELKAEADKAEQYRSQYPGSMHFDYVWDKSKGKSMGLEAIWRDDKFTYLRGHFQETPALYEV
jgi:type IV secretory pathway VirB9-like protein